MGNVFLSYSPEDGREAAIVCDELRGHGLDVFWDWEIAPGENWAERMGRALEKTSDMVVLVSPAAMTSDLVKRVLSYATFNARFEGRVFPVIVRQTSDLPTYFNMLQVTDLRRERAQGMKSLVKAIKEKQKGDVAFQASKLRTATKSQKLRTS